jgi:hypothetical protein
MLMPEVHVTVKVTEKYDAANRKRTIMVEVSPDPIEVDSPRDLIWNLDPGSTPGWEFNEADGVTLKHRQYEYRADTPQKCAWHNRYTASGRTHRYTINLARHGNGADDPPATISWDPTIKNQ